MCVVGAIRMSLIWGSLRDFRKFCDKNWLRFTFELPFMSLSVPFVWCNNEKAAHRRLSNAQTSHGKHDEP